MAVDFITWQRLQPHIFPLEKPFRQFLLNLLRGKSLWRAFCPITVLITLSMLCHICTQRQGLNAADFCGVTILFIFQGRSNRRKPEHRHR